MYKKYSWLKVHSLKWRALEMQSNVAYYLCNKINSTMFHKWKWKLVFFSFISKTPNKEILWETSSLLGLEFCEIFVFKPCWLVIIIIIIYYLKNETIKKRFYVIVMTSGYWFIVYGPDLWSHEFQITSWFPIKSI